MVRLTDFLASRGLDPEALEKADRSEAGLVAALWDDGAVDQGLLLGGLGEYFQMPVLAQVPDTAGPANLDAAPLSYLRSHSLAPLEVEDGVLTVALADPTDLAMAADLKIAFGVDRLEPKLARPADIRAAVSRMYERFMADTQEAIQEIDEEMGYLSLADLEESEDLMDATTDAPVIRLVNLILVEAVKRRVSDIHIEPYRDSLKVRYRIDGLLHDTVDPPRGLASAVSARIKVMSDLDIAERRLPQDGRFQIKVANREIDVRVSVVPTSFGERIVLRLLNKSAALLTLTDLGMADDTLAGVRDIISQSSGIILVTGPTGSGKTTTLYAGLMEINTPEKNILTVEDPVEYQIAGVGQMQMNAKVGLTFANALRSILRHDPDVIMVGEIRDAETAQIAIHASQTGHLVFSTLHTNNAAGAVTRLVDMGIEPFLISSSLSAVLAQRLIRLLCPHCRVETEYPAAVLAKLGLTPEDGPFYGSRGCTDCFGSGFQGRVGIYELLNVTEPIRELVLARSTAGAMEARAVELGMRSLRLAGAAKVKAGLTTPDEVLRVVHGSVEEI